MDAPISILYDVDTIKNITAVQFDVLGSHELKRMSALDGKTPGVTMFDLFDNTEPKRGGLLDLRMGTADNQNLCATCGFNTRYCVGHFGHIDFAEPVFHLGFMQILKKILDSVCVNCSKILIHKNEDMIADILKIRSGKARLAEVRAAVRNVQHCKKSNDGCGAIVPKIKVEIKKKNCTVNIIAEYQDTSKEEGADQKKKVRLILTPDAVYNILKNISDDDCRILGFDPDKSRPENMIHKIFPVPPVHVRPSAKRDFGGSKTSEDDLTRKLTEVVRTNMKLLRQKDLNPDLVTKYAPRSAKDNGILLQCYIAQYFDDEAISNPKADKGRPFKALAPRLKTKEGRIRNNLMGKRTNFTARTVITPDPTISVNEVGVPVRVAMNLTFPETVTEDNLEFLSELVRRGKDRYPGANFVFNMSANIPGKRVSAIDLRFRKEKVELRYGDIVERHLMDGDIVLLNRQPTLHRQSMMGHRIRVINDPSLMTFRMSVAATKPYNADFDGRD